MRFDVMRLDDVRPPRVHEPAQIVNDLRIIPMPLEEDVERKSRSRNLRERHVDPSRVPHGPPDERESDGDVNAPHRLVRQPCVLDRVSSDTGEPRGLDERENVESTHSFKTSREPSSMKHSTPGATRLPERSLMTAMQPSAFLAFIS
jgi:hypothetical protein